MPGCRRGFEESIRTGLLIGAPVRGLRAVVVDGAYHAVDSSELAFRNCAVEAFREAYERAGPVVLEPFMRVQAETPEEFQGAVFGLLQRRRAEIVGTDRAETGLMRVEGLAPLSEMFGFSTALRSATQGRAEFGMEFGEYRPAPREIASRLIATH